jgi:hypothetical protein
MTEDGHAVKTHLIAQARTAVDGLSEDQVLNTDSDALTEYLVQQYSFEIPELDLGNVTATEHERTVHRRHRYDQREVSMPGMAIDFSVPFTGDATVFRITPATYDTGPPHAEVRDGMIRFSVSGHELSAEQVQQEYEETISSLQKYLGWHKEFWKGFAGEAAREVRGAIDRRRARLAKQKAVGASLAGLGVKLLEKKGDARTYAAPAVKQKIKPKMPPMVAAAKPEPTLDAAQYATIIQLIVGAGRSIEQSSSRMRMLDEESLRDTMLVPLNAHFGAATGEAFNYSGKTDILIRHEGKNLFVAECKFWQGIKAYLEAIDQLLGYLTWRDTKSVLVVFSKNTKFTDVIHQIRERTAEHHNFVSGPELLDETCLQFVFSLPQDAERQGAIAEFW